jgi:hypothetical protein
VAAADDKSKAEQVYREYFEALGRGDMDAVADRFTFPAAFKGFLDDVITVADKAALLAAYGRLIAAAPKAHHSRIVRVAVSDVRPGIFMLTAEYEQFDAQDALVYAGKAVYFFKRLEDGEIRLFAVF